MALAKIGNFDDWIDLFKVWQDDIGLEAKELKNYNFEVKLGDIEVDEIEFGHYAGQRKWPTVMHIPDQRIRDALQNRSEEHTSELQSHVNLVCRLLLEKKKTLRDILE